MDGDKQEERQPSLSMFKDTPGSIKTLRRYYKDKLKQPDRYTLQGELAGESDRASIILMAAILDDTLTLRIAKSFSFKPTKEEFEEIFRPEGPLGSFSAKMQIACLFGVIDDSTFQQLDIIRELRNACAHSMHNLTFADEVLANVVRRLFRPLGLLPQLARDASAEDIKSQFVVEGIYLIQVLSEGSRDAARKYMIKMLEEAAASVPPSPDKPPSQPI